MSSQIICFFLYTILLSSVFFPWLKTEENKQKCNKKDRPIVYSVFYFLVLIHLLAGVGMLSVSDPKPQSISYTFFLSVWFALSVTGGKHRLYTHQTYKAHPLLELFYLLGATTVPSSSIQDWVETHKIHHRFSDTYQDPHYSSEDTFYYSHFGWIYHARSKEEIENIKKENLGYLYKNPFVSFQKKYHGWLLGSIQSCLFFLPLLWGDFMNCFWLSIIRIMVALNCQFSVNSLAHSIGDRPYDPNIRPTQNHLVSLLTFGEGYHNYHHLYPKDFRASDSSGGWNPTTWFLYCMWYMGLASDFKYLSKDTKKWEVLK